MNQGLTYERQNFKNFKSKCKNYLYDLGRISSSKQKNSKSQRKRLENLHHELFSSLSYLLLNIILLTRIFRGTDVI